MSHPYAPCARGPRRKTSPTSHLSVPMVYVPGTSVIHRASPKVKLVSLLALTLVFATVRIPILSLGSLALAATVFGAARLPLMILKPLLFTLPALAAMSGFHLWTGNPDLAIAVPLSLLSCIMLATVVTVTTPLNAIVAMLTAALAKFCKPATAIRIGLGVALLIRTVPLLLLTVSETLTALRSRGVRPSVKTFLIPLFIRATSDALELGDALHARGILDSPIN